MLFSGWYCTLAPETAQINTYCIHATFCNSGLPSIHQLALYIYIFLFLLLFCFYSLLSAFCPFSVLLFPCHSRLHYIHATIAGLTRKVNNIISNVWELCSPLLSSILCGGAPKNTYMPPFDGRETTEKIVL